VTQALTVDFSARPQALAHRAFRPKQTVCIPWGRGGGKSTVLRLLCYLLIAWWDSRKRPGSDETGVRIAIILPTLVQARKIHLRKMVAELAGRWAWLGAKPNLSEFRFDFPGGSWIQFVSAEALEGARGLRLDVAIVDEADDVDIEPFDAILIPWFTEPHSLCMTLVSGTPKRGRYGLLYRTHARGIGKLLDDDGRRFTDHRSFHASCYDFPRYVSAAAIAKAKRETAPAIFAREWLCDFDSAEGLVYPMFSEAFHVLEPHHETVWSEVLVGADWGWEDPACFLVIGVTGAGQDARAHVIHEVYRSHMTDDQLVAEAAQIVGWYPSAKWFPDPSRPDRIALLKSKAGVRFGDVDNAIEAGVDCVSNLLAVRPRENAQPEARLYVSSRCPNTIREMGVYRRKRDPKNKERVLDDIEDKNNHAMDALRYPLLARFRVREKGGRNDRGAEQRQ